VRLVDNGGNSSGVLSPVNDNSRGIVPALKLNLKQVYSLYDKSDYLGHMKFNNMIPLAEGTYETAFGRYDFNYDSLLSKQKSFIVNNFDKEVVPRFYSAFSTQALSKDEPDNKFYAIYNNFPLLATKAAVWQLIVNVEKEINKRLSLDPPKEEEAYNALKRVLNNESCQDVLKFKKDTNQYFKGLYDKFRMQEAARKSAEEILRLEKEGQLFNGWDTSDKGKSKDDGGRTK